MLVFTQKDLAGKLRVSLSTVNNALKLPRSAGAIEVGGRNFRIRDKEKFLLLWASHRRVGSDVIYQTKVFGTVPEIEGLVPPGVIFGAFSAVIKKYQIAPADYNAVYLYADPKILPELKKRFPLQKGSPNLVVLKADAWLKNFGEVTPSVQTFVDLWNMPQWYAKDFLQEVRRRLKFST